MPLVINAFRTYTQTRIPMRKSNQFQKTRHARPSAMCTWFKKAKGIGIENKKLWKQDRDIVYKRLHVKQFNPQTNAMCLKTTPYP